MRKIFPWKLRAAFFLPILASILYADSPDTSNSLAQFVAGIEMLEEMHDIDTMHKALLFEQLERVTDIPAVRVVELLNEYRSAPEKWKEIQQAVVALLETYKSPKPDTLFEKEQHHGKGSNHRVYRQ